MTIKFTTLFNTKPSIIHANGGFSDSVTQFTNKIGIRYVSLQRYASHFQNIENLVQFVTTEPLEKTKFGPFYNNKDSRLLIVTWNNKTSKGITEQFANAWGVDCCNLIKAGSEFQTIYKITSLLENLKYINTPYIMGLDANDVMILEHPTKILDRFIDRFESNGYKMLINAETNDYPSNMTKIEYEFTDSQWHFLNSGAYIGTKEYISKFLTKALLYYPELDNQHNDKHCLDQGCFKKAYQDSQINHEVILDYKCEIFLCLYGCNTNDIKIQIN